MWMTVAMSYYGLILINTSIMTVLNDRIESSNQNQSNECKMLSTDDYKSLIFTTFGEMFGIPLLLFFLSQFGRRRIYLINFASASLCFLSFIFISREQLWLVYLITFIARMFINSQFCLMYLYTMEVYPTVIRAMAVGFASSMARIGAMITPYLAQVLIKRTFYGTILIYVLATSLAAICAYLLPIETRNRELKVKLSKKKKTQIQKDFIFFSSKQHPMKSEIPHEQIMTIKDTNDLRMMFKVKIFDSICLFV